MVSSPSTLTLAGDQLVVTQGYGNAVQQIDTNTGKVVALAHRPPDVWVATAALVKPNTVAMSGLGQTQFYDTVTHKLSSPPLGDNGPGNINHITATVDGSYTLTALISGPQQPISPGSLQVIDNHNFQIRGVFGVGYGPTSIAVSTDTVAAVVNAANYTGPTWVLLVPLQKVLEPASVRLNRSHAAAGETIDGQVSRFGPGETLTATLHSTPKQLAQIPVGDNSTSAAFRFTVPHGLTPGTHTVTVTDPNLNMTAQTTLVITAPRRHRRPAPSRHTRAHTAGQHRHTHRATAGVGLLLAVVGVLVLIASRRRSAISPDHEDLS